MELKDKGRYLIGLILLVVLTASVYLVMQDQGVKIDIQSTRTFFYVDVDGKWQLSGIEYVNLFDGTTKMRASSRNLETYVDGNTTYVIRTANYKQNISTIETYMFNGSTKDVELFPVYHEIRVINGQGKILQYEVTNLVYDGPTVNNIESPQSYGLNMKVEWSPGNYYSRIWGYANRDEGKLTIRYRPNSSDYTIYARLFDPVPVKYVNVTLVSPDNETEFIINPVTFKANFTSLQGFKSANLWTNTTGIWQEEQSMEGVIFDKATNATYPYFISSDSLQPRGWEIRVGDEDIILTNVTWLIGTEAKVAEGLISNVIQTVNITGNVSYHYLTLEAGGVYQIFTETTANYRIIDSTVHSSDEGLFNYTHYYNGPGFRNNINTVSAQKVGELNTTFSLFSGWNEWNVEVCTLEDECEFADENLSVFMGDDKPLVTIHSPVNITYNTPSISLNITTEGIGVADTWYFPTCQPSFFDNVIVYYPFEEETGPVRDVYGNRDGNLTGSMDRGENGYIGKAYDFAGNDNILVPFSDLNLYETGFSINFWIKSEPHYFSVVNQLSAPYGFVLDYGEQTVGSELWAFRLIFEDGTSTYITRSEFYDLEDEWIFVSANYDPSTNNVFFWVNGSTRSPTYSGGEFSASVDLLIRGEGTDPPLSGRKMDELLILNRSLSLEEVELLYNTYLDNIYTVEKQLTSFECKELDLRVFSSNDLGSVGIGQTEFSIQEAIIELESPSDGTVTSETTITFSGIINKFSEQDLVNLSIYINHAGEWILTNTTSVSDYYKGLEMFLKFEGDGEPIDSTGNYLINIDGVVTKEAIGKIGDAYNFTKEGYITSDLADVITYDNNWSLNIWLQPSNLNLNTTDNIRTIFLKNTGSTESSFQMYLRYSNLSGVVAHRIEIIVYGPLSSWTRTVLTANESHLQNLSMYTLNYDSDAKQFRTFVNSNNIVNLSIDSDGDDRHNFTTSQPLIIGSTWEGLTDEFMVFSRPLTEAEIQVIYMDGEGRNIEIEGYPKELEVFINSGIEENTISLWKLETCLLNGDCFNSTEEWSIEHTSGPRILVEDILATDETFKVELGSILEISFDIREFPSGSFIEAFLDVFYRLLGLNVASGTGTTIYNLSIDYFFNDEEGDTYEFDESELVDKWNLVGSFDATYDLSDSYDPFGNNVYATLFTTPSAGDLTINSIALNFLSFSSVQTHSIDVAIRASDPSGADITTNSLTLQDIQSSECLSVGCEYILTLPEATLSPNTNYTIVVSCADCTAPTDLPKVLSGSAPGLLGAAYSDDGGTTWDPWLVNNSFIFKLGKYGTSLEKNYEEKIINLSFNRHDEIDTILFNFDYGYDTLYDFENDTEGWVASSGPAMSLYTNWSTRGEYSLKILATGGIVAAGQFMVVDVDMTSVNYITLDANVLKFPTSGGDSGPVYKPGDCSVFLGGGHIFLETFDSTGIYQSIYNVSELTGDHCFGVIVGSGVGSGNDAEVAIDNVQFHSEYLKEPARDLLIYKPNTTDLEKAYYGNITTSGYINQDQFIEIATDKFIDEEEVIFPFGTNRRVYFLIDKFSTIKSFTFDLSFMTQGFYFFERFNRENFRDATSTAVISGGRIIPLSTSVLSFVYDDFSGSFNESLWFKYPNTGGSVSNYFIWSLQTSQSGGSLNNVLNTRKTGSYGYSKTLEVNQINRMPNDLINIYALDELELIFDFQGTRYTYVENSGRASGELCWSPMGLQIDGVSVWSDYNSANSFRSRCRFDRFEDGADCYTSYSTEEDISVKLTRQTEGFRVQISGIEKWEVEDRDYCGRQFFDVNWNTGIMTYTSDYCSQFTRTLNNDFITEFTGQGAGGIDFYMQTRSSTNTYGYGCEQNDMTFKIKDVNFKTSNYSDSTFISKLLFESQTDVTELTPTIKGSIPTGTDIDFYLSADGKANWESITSGTPIIFTNPGKLLYFKADFDVGGTGYKTLTPFIDSLELVLEDSDVTNLTIDLGANGVVDYQINGTLSEDNGTITVDLSSVNFNFTYDTEAYEADTYRIPIDFFSETAGIMNIGNLSVIYDPRPIYLDVLNYNNYLSNLPQPNTSTIVDIPLVFSSSGFDSSIKIDYINTTYAGGNQTYEVMVRNDNGSVNASTYLNYFYSRWDYEWGNDDIDYIWFRPLTPTQKNVPPYGQTLLTPILIIENLGYASDADLYVKVDKNLDCVNMTILSNGSKKEITTEWVLIKPDFSYLDTFDVFLYADYSCSYNNWKIFDPIIYFRQCATDSFCGEEVS